MQPIKCREHMSTFFASVALTSSKQERVLHIILMHGTYLGVFGPLINDRNRLEQRTYETITT